MKIKLFKKKKKFRKASLHLNPLLFWKLAILLILTVGVFASVFGYNLFKQINKEVVVSVSEDSSKVETVDPERISKVLDNFSLREKKSASILNSVVPVVDPSL